MDAAWAMGAVRDTDRRAMPLVAVRRMLAWALTASLALAAALLMSRRLAGALVEPLSARSLIAVGLAGAVVALAAHLLDKERWSRFKTPWLGAGDWIACLSLLAAAIAVSLPGSSPAGLAVLWISLFATALALWKAPGAKRHGIANWRDAPTVEILQSDDAENHATTQKLVYHRTADGTSTIEGWLRVDAVPGQRVAIAHIAFCPAFVKCPTVQAELLDGPSCAIRPTLVLPWGVRWEVKLDEAAEEPLSVAFGFAATERDS